MKPTTKITTIYSNRYIQCSVDSVHKHDILLATGDLNAKFGEDNEGYENIIGSHRVGVRNENGEKTH